MRVTIALNIKFTSFGSDRISLTTFSRVFWFRLSMNCLKNCFRVKSFLKKTCAGFFCCKSTGYVTACNSFKFSDLVIELAEPSQKKQKPDPSNLVFGKHFSDHMFEVQWTADQGWGVPHISPVHDFLLHPAAKVLHYAIEGFEGMKAFRGFDGNVRLFRPELNVQRFLGTSERISLPTFDGEEFLKCLKKLIQIDKDWVPNGPSSLYIRPTSIGIEPSLGVAASKNTILYVLTGPVGSYFKTGARSPVSLFADPKYVRAWPGGTGDRKIGANYGPTVHVQQQAEKQNLQQVLWLYGNDHELTEVGTMNIFIFLINCNGEKELVTPPLNGIILPGVIRQSVLDMVREWNEFKVSERIITMKEVINALEDGRLLEIFGSGTACVICPVSSISYMEKVIKLPTYDMQNSLNERIFQTLTDIQNGVIPSSWAVKID